MWNIYKIQIIANIRYIIIIKAKISQLFFIIEYRCGNFHLRNIFCVDIITVY